MMASRKVGFVLILATLCAVLPACSGAPVEQPEPREEAVDVVFVDPAIDISVQIGNPEWIYQRDGSGQVYFYNEDRTHWAGVIAISSQPLDGDGTEQTEVLWTKAVSNFPESDLNVTEEKEIEVGQGYAGKEYGFSVSTDGHKQDAKYLFWAAGDKLYTCTVTSDAAGEEEVDDALEDITDSFKTFEDIGKE